MAAYLDQLNRVRRFLARIENQARASVDYDMGKKVPDTYWKLTA